MSSHSDKLKTHDQDVLNALLHDKCKHVSRKWNTEEAFYHYYVIKKWRKMNSKEMKKVLDKTDLIRYNKQAVAKRQQTGTLIIEQQPSLKIQK